MSFRSKPSNLARAGIFRLGYTLTRHTRTSQILDLMKRLRPHNCGKPLIRVGGPNDGGYLVPDDLDGIEYCFSPGVSTVSDFEDQLADRGIKCFLADYSVDSPPIKRPEFVFDKKFLGATDYGRYMTLASWKEKYLGEYEDDMMLQMDIEGYEYQVLLNTPDRLLNQFRIIVIEFHHLERIFDPFFFEFLSSCFEKLLESFHVVHIHPNNCCGSVAKGNLEVPRLMEFTFLNRRRASHITPQRTFPHRLDAPNIDGAALQLPKCWYAEA